LQENKLNYLEIDFDLFLFREIRNYEIFVPIDKYKIKKNRFLFFKKIYTFGVLLIRSFLIFLVKTTVIAEAEIKRIKRS